MTFNVPEPVFAYWLAAHYQTAIQDAYAAIRGERPALAFVADAA